MSLYAFSYFILVTITEEEIFKYLSNGYYHVANVFFENHLNWVT